MPLPFRLGGSASRDYAVFGKLPGRPDFLRVLQRPICLLQLLQLLLNLKISLLKLNFHPRSCTFSYCN